MKLEFFKFDCAAWLTGKVQLLSAEEKGVFIEIVARIWYNGGTLKNDEILHRVLRVEKGTLSSALAVFFELGIMEEKEGVLSLKFVDEQLDEINSYKSQQAEFGKKGGRPKKGTLRVEKPIKNKIEIKKEKEYTEVYSKKKPTLSPEYPSTVEEVLEIAALPQCAVRITREDAEKYFVTRMSTDWVDAAGRKINPEGIIWDLKKWEMGTNERKGSPMKKAVGFDRSDPSTWGDL